MKKFMLISISSLLALIWVGFFGISTAQDYGYTFGFLWMQEDAHRFTAIQMPDSVPDVVALIKTIYGVDDIIEQLPFVAARNAFLLADAYYGHGSADQELTYEIQPSVIGKILHGSKNFEAFYQKVRINIIGYLIENNYSNFNDQPYPQGNSAIVAQSWDFKILENITQDDGLDTLLKAKLEVFRSDFANLKKFGNYLNFKKIAIDAEEYSDLWTLFMFKNEQDLRGLWYELISWKSRINTDPDYRRHNIMTAFSNIGNVRLIKPGEIFSLTHELHYSPYAGDGSKPFVDGYATLGGVVEMVYGGWLCGVGTAFYQGTLTNLWLALLKYRAHSIYYRNLYEAEINGIAILEPWLDATVYDPYFDVKVQNIRDYPIIVVFNFDGLSGSVEQMFTLSKAQDRGSFEYVGTYKKWWLKCFTREINWENRTNCYGQIKNF